MTSVTGPDPDGEGPQSAPTTRFGYDPAGNQTSVTDPLGRATLSAFDAQNRLLSQTLPDPDGAGPLQAPQTRYGYTLDSQLASITDPVGNVTSYHYDDAGRLVEVGDPIFYQYDAAGQVIGITDRNGRQRTFTYNDLGEKTSETWLGENNAPVRLITWAYDDAGQLVQATDPDSSYRFTYDIAGQVTSVDNFGTPNVPNVVLNYAYDFAGNRTLLVDNLGGRIDYAYANHRLDSMQWTVNNVTVAQLSFGYDTVGRPTSLTRTDPSSGRQIATTYGYDDGDRLTSITHTLDPQGTSTVLSQFTYEFDLANQITSYTGPEGTLNYEYDQTGQLIGVSGARTEDYSYDENGNRTMPGYVTGDFNRLLSDGTYDYTYDLEGNMLTKTRIADGEKTTFTWDHRNRLTHIVVTNATDDILKEAVYTYDVFDRRIGVWEDADGAGLGQPSQRWTVYDGDNPYVDFDGNGSLTTQYLYGQAMDQLFARYSQGGGVDWYLTDILGSVRQIADTDGTILDALAYSTFGQVLSETNPANGDRFKFTARELDALFGQYNYRARYYGPDIGRFTQEDPLSFGAGDSNIYRYVGNGPTNAIDPTGEWGWIIGTTIVGGLIGGIRAAIQGQGLGGILRGAAAGAAAGFVFGATIGVGLASGVALNTARGLVTVGIAGALAGQTDRLIMGEWPRSTAEQLNQMAWDGACAMATQGIANRIFRQARDVRAPVGRPVPHGYKRVYRAVSEAEYQDILRTGRFNRAPNGIDMEGRWFADTLEGAQAHGNALYGQRGFRIIEADVPTNAPSFFQRPNLDGRGPATYLHLNDLVNVTPRPVGS